MKFKHWKSAANLIENFHLIFISETIINEHPVTIYPGPPQKRVPPRTLPGSIERHRDVCRKNPTSESSSSSSSSPSSSTSPHELKSPTKELKSPIQATSNNGFILKNDDFIKRPKSPQICDTSPTTMPFGIKISIQTMDNLMNNRNIIHNAKLEKKMNFKNSKRNSQLSDNDDDDEDKFSDDSLEDTSLPPPAPPVVIPPPPSLSAPVTPSKRHSIAWEVNLDDLCSSGNGITTKVKNLNILSRFYFINLSCPIHGRPFQFFFIFGCLRIEHLKDFPSLIIHSSSWN